MLDEATGIYSMFSDPDGVATVTRGINDAGQIVGSHTDSNGNTQAFLATPQPSAAVPEPASIALLGTGLLGLSRIRRRRSQPG